jgi:hypothetical protein
MFEVIPSNSSYNTIVNSTVMGRLILLKQVILLLLERYVKFQFYYQLKVNFYPVNENNDSTGYYQYNT